MHLCNANTNSENIFKFWIFNLCQCDCRGTNSSCGRTALQIALMRFPIGRRCAIFVIYSIDLHRIRWCHEWMMAILESNRARPLFPLFVSMAMECRGLPSAKTATHCKRRQKIKVEIAPNCLQLHFNVNRFLRTAPARGPGSHPPQKFNYLST